MAFLVYIPFLFYVHEGGHILGGLINDVITGNPLQKYTITNWVSAPFNPFLLLPQQTTGPASLANLYGGPYFSVLFFLIITALIYFKSNFKTKDRLILIPIYVIISQIVENYYCGTDNFTNKPLLNCNDNSLFSTFFQWDTILLIAIFFILIYPIVKTEFPYWIDKILVMRGKRGEYL